LFLFLSPEVSMFSQKQIPSSREIDKKKPHLLAFTKLCSNVIKRRKQILNE